MRVLVTGANGYLGRATVAALATAGHEPIPMVHNGSAATPHAAIAADLTDEESLCRALARIDAVVHLAGLTRARESFANPLRYFQVNTVGTINLLGAMASAGVSRLVFASTASVYGTPDQQPMSEETPDTPPHPYAASKLAAELAIEAQVRTGALSAIVVRLFNVAGGADPDPTRLFPRAVTAARSHTAFEVNGDGSTVRDYLHISDAAAAFVACVGGMPPAGTSTRYNIGSGHGLSVLDVVAAVERATEREIRLVHKRPVAEPPVLIADTSKANSELSWRPAHSDADAIARDASLRAFAR